MFNVQKLQKEIDAAGIPNDGVSADGVISFKESATSAQRSAAAAIKAVHDPTDTSGALRQSALNYLQGVSFAARRTAINNSSLAAGQKALLRAINRTEWALAVLVLGLVEDDPGEN